MMVLVLLVVRVLRSAVEVYMFYVRCGLGDTCVGPCIIAGSVVTLYTGCELLLLLWLTLLHVSISVPLPSLAFVLFVYCHNSPVRGYKIMVLYIYVGYNVMVFR